MPGRLAAEVPLETVEETGTISAATRSDELGPPSHFTCPECEGTLYEISDGAAVRFRCRVGHAYSEDAMLSAQGESVERALWTALRALEERSALLRKLAKSAERRGQRAIALMFRNRGEQVEDDVKAIHDVITTGRSLEPVTEDDAE
jgi:two-component system chemotaxis response regulator CheB